MGEDSAVAVGDDIVGHEIEAQLVEDGRFPHTPVADGMPADGIAVHITAALLRAGIETDADEAQLAAMVVLEALQAALRILAVVAPRRPGADDIDLGIEIGTGDGAAVDIGGGELGELGLDLEAAQPFELLLHPGDGMIVGGSLGDDGDQARGLVVVGRGGLDERAVEEEDARRRLGMVGDEGLGLLRHLGGRHLAGLQAEGREDLVLLGALHLDFLQVGGIALDGDLLAGLADDGQLGEVGEDDDIGAGGIEGGGVVETAIDDGDGVEFLRGAVGGVDIELALVEALELTGDLEVVAVGAARC